MPPTSRRRDAGQTFDGLDPLVEIRRRVHEVVDAEWHGQLRMETSFSITPRCPGVVPRPRNGCDYNTRVAVNGTTSCHVLCTARGLRHDARTARKTYVIVPVPEFPDCTKFTC